MRSLRKSLCICKIKKTSVRNRPSSSLLLLRDIRCLASSPGRPCRRHCGQPHAVPLPNTPVCWCLSSSLKFPNQRGPSGTYTFSLRLWPPHICASVLDPVRFLVRLVAVCLSLRLTRKALPGCTCCRSRPALTPTGASLAALPSAPTHLLKHGKVENRLKTASSTRMADLHPTIAALLKRFVGERRDGFLFRTRNGKPLSSCNVLKRHRKLPIIPFRRKVTQDFPA